MKNKVLFYVLIFIISYILFSCKTTGKLKALDTPVSISEDNYLGTIFPMDTTKLWVTQGDFKRDTVAIFCQGGPLNRLKFLDQQKTSWRYLPQYKGYFNVHLHQSNTYNPEMFLKDEEFTIESAREEVDNSSEMLYRAISYFKTRGKTVYVFGHSYGAFIIPHYLATRPSLADNYIMVSGRIEDPLEAVKYHKDGFNGYYENGLTFIPDTKTEVEQMDVSKQKAYRVKQLLKAAIGELNYYEALRDLNLNNAVYIHSRQDERVGNLTTNEIIFLKNKGMQVLSTKYNHGETIYGLVDLVETGKVKL